MKNLKILRKKKGFTQQEVASYLNIGRSSYTKYESGTHIPDVYLLEKIALLYGVTLDELVGQPHIIPGENINLEKKFHSIMKKLEMLSDDDLKEIESYIDFKYEKKTVSPTAKNIS